MTGIKYVAGLWTLWFITQTGCVCSDFVFFERQEGDSVVLHCVFEQREPPPFGVYLKRRWLHASEVLFMHTKSEVSVLKAEYRNRISVSGDPSSRALNVTISELRVDDTDRYDCEFMVENPSSEDLRLPGKTEFFLLVRGDTPGWENIGLVQTCAGGSATLPCLPPSGEGLAVDGVSLKRQRGRAPVEVLYHSKRDLGGGPPPSSSQFPVEKIQLSSAPGPGGITYNLTLQQLQLDDSGLYSCQLLLRGRPDSTTSLGKQVFFLSVQGGQCGCSNYSTLLYALSSAVAVLLILLILVVIYRGKSRRSGKSRSQAPIYEEMAGVQTARGKLASQHLEEMQFSEYRNCPVKKSCPENHYESPTGALYPRRDSRK
uniref:cd7 antigen-like n=1 Tax=Scatophagus argus TaxID=75038 RepID=UPI001ED7F2B0|nr:cd7 antigen-like [Scatophagus argus]XP_046266781.1 cd7 antigen-like [Scatophagus argus]XP_046266792.1 cd7 antigen-like [Scatophagus argus]